MIVATTQALHAVQQRLHGMAGLYRREAVMRADPFRFSLADHFNTARHLQIAVVEEWRLQQFLPTEAPNDPPALPGAA